MGLLGARFGKRALKGRALVRHALKAKVAKGRATKLGVRAFRAKAAARAHAKIARVAALA